MTTIFTGVDTIVSRLDEIRNRIEIESQVDAADKVMATLATLTEKHGYDYKVRQRIKGSEWCVRRLKSKDMPLDNLKDLCWEVIEDAEAGRVAKNVQTFLPFGLGWDEAEPCADS